MAFAEALAIDLPIELSPQLAAKALESEFQRVEQTDNAGGIVVRCDFRRANLTRRNQGVAEAALILQSQNCLNNLHGVIRICIKRGLAQLFLNPLNCTRDDRTAESKSLQGGEIIRTKVTHKSQGKCLTIESDQF